MGTTSGVLAAQAMDALAAAGADFAFLHKESDVAAGRVGSDLDLVTRWSASDLVRRVDWGPLTPVMLWHYDRGAASLFLMREDASGGVQIDVTYDVGGKYGIDPHALLYRAVNGERWPTVTDADRSAYVETKRRVKAEGRKYPTAARTWSRLRQPVGFWAHVEGGSQAEFDAVVARFAAVLPRTRSALHGPASAASAVGWRMLPCGYFTHGWRTSAPGADVQVDARPVDEACAEIVRTLGDRTRAAG